MSEEYVTPDYETITTSQKRRLKLAVNAFLDAFSKQDYEDVVTVLLRIAERLENQSGGCVMPDEFFFRVREKQNLQ